MQKVMKGKMSACEKALHNQWHVIVGWNMSTNVRMCAQVSTLYPLNATECCGRVGNVNKYTRLNERRQGG